MDNAQKAIMIGVGLFITIIIISAVLLITNMGTDMVNSAREQLSGVSTDLQNSVLSMYDGKTVTGSDVKTAMNTYRDSEMSIVVYNGATYLKTGKFEITSVVNPDDASFGFTTTYEGGLTTTPSGTEYAVLSTKATSSQINSGISSSQRYYSYMIKDASTDIVMGILFVRAGSNGFSATSF